MNSQPDKLDLIATESARRLRNAINEAHQDILEAWAHVNAQAMEDEKDPILTLSFAIKLDLGGNSLVTALSYGVRRKLEEAGEIPDPNQPELPIEGDQVCEDQARDEVGAIDRANSRKRGAN